MGDCLCLERTRGRDLKTRSSELLMQRKTSLAIQLLQNRQYSWYIQSRVTCTCKLRPMSSADTSSLLSVARKDERRRSKVRHCGVSRGGDNRGDRCGFGGRRGEVFLKNVAGLALASDDCEKGVDTGKSKNEGVLKVSVLGNAAVD